MPNLYVVIEQPKKCLNCSDSNVLPCLSGLIGDDYVEEYNKKYALMGCYSTDADPQWACKSCWALFFTEESDLEKYRTYRTMYPIR
jgi:hypothetical protein